MIYFRRFRERRPPDIAAIEDAGHAARYEATGYQRCSRAEFCAAWRIRDASRIGELWGRLVQTAPLARAVGELRQADGTVIPPGYWQ